jgi:hypothetical protein
LFVKAFGDMTPEEFAALPAEEQRCLFDAVKLNQEEEDVNWTSTRRAMSAAHPLATCSPSCSPAPLLCSTSTLAAVVQELPVLPAAPVYGPLLHPENSSAIPIHLAAHQVE